MKYPDEWSGFTLRLLAALVLAASGAFNVLTWFTGPERSAWWLIEPAVSIALGALFALSALSERRRRSRPTDDSRP